MDRVRTGVKGVDELLEGGIPEGSAVLLTGGSGTGKTIFALQYLYEGAKTYEEPGVFITLEGNVKNITWNMENFNWDIKKLQDKSMLKIYRLNRIFTYKPRHFFKNTTQFPHFYRNHPIIIYRVSWIILWEGE